MNLLKGLRIFLIPDDGGEGTLLGGNNSAGEGNNQPQNNDKTPSTNNSAGEGSPTVMPGWLAGYPKEMRENKEFWKFQKPGDFYEAHKALSEKLSRSIVRPPAEGATPEEVAAYRKEIGIPDSSDKYDFSKIEGLPAVDEKFATRLREACFSAELSQGQAEKVYGEVNKIVSETVSEIAKQNAETRDAAVIRLKQEYGGNYPAVLDKAKAALAFFGSPELISKLNSNGLGNDFDLIKMLASIGDKIGGDSLLTNSASMKPGATSARFPNSPGMYNN